MRLTKSELRLRDRLAEISRRLPCARKTLGKAHIRKLHIGKRIAVIGSMNGAFEGYMDLLRTNLAAPREIDIAKISPEFQLVESGTRESELFNAASLLWSVPVSKGFGRRMRFLVQDKANGKLIGIIGLTDPVFNLAPRDAWVGWTSEDRTTRLVNVMDAFVLGAVPPYNRILGGKLVALLATSKEVVRRFRRKYRTSAGIISGSRKDPRLVLLTTTSALGRSSLYNRLRIPGSVEYLTEVEKDRVGTWYTQGFGHFHIPDGIFQALQNVLVRREHPYATGNRFGDGPNWKIRVIRRAVQELGLDPTIVQHGIRRQVYVVPLAKNARPYLLGQAKRPLYLTKTVHEIADFWRTRWGVPRSERYPEWRNWNSGGIVAHLTWLHEQAKVVEG